MPIWLGVILVLGALFVALNLFWRYGSRKTHAPCPSWLSWMLEAGGSGERPFGRGRAIDDLELAQGMRVADVGCGPGLLTVPIARAVGPEGEVVALDLQQRMLDRMQRRVDTSGLTNVRPLLAGAGEGKLAREYFDRAVLSTVLGEIPDRVSALREIHDALKPGGYLVVAEVIGDPHYQFKKNVAAMGRDAGLEPGRVDGGFWAYRMRLHRSA
jgi:2-polyprenyl-3-methyl-5-hydroxy-6-metoxy-1,4-benzoquinol methylase